MTTLTNHIETTPGIAGGKPRISGHRITVQDVVVCHDRLGQCADEIATQYGLTLGEVYSALAYYHDNRESVDASIREDEAFVERLRSQVRPKLTARTRA